MPMWVHRMIDFLRISRAFQSIRMHLQDPTTYPRYLRLLFPPSPSNDHLYSQYSLLRQIGPTTEAYSDCS